MLIFIVLNICIVIKIITYNTSKNISLPLSIQVYFYTSPVYLQGIFRVFGPKPSIGTWLQSIKSYTEEILVMYQIINLTPSGKDVQLNEQRILKIILILPFQMNGKCAIILQNKRRSSYLTINFSYIFISLTFNIKQRSSLRDRDSSKQTAGPHTEPFHLRSPQYLQQGNWWATQKIGMKLPGPSGLASTNNYRIVYQHLASRHNYISPLTGEISMCMLNSGM